MLFDFIESNKLDSKLVNSSKPISSLTQAIQLTGLDKSEIFKSSVFLDELNNVWIVLFPWFKRLDESLVKKVVPLFDFFLNEKETLEATGYSFGLVPPISVYDARLLIDSSFKNKSLIAGVVETNETLLLLDLSELSDLISEIVYARITK